MTIDELKPGRFYSNGAYGRTWGVRQLAAISTHPESGETLYEFKGVAGACRRENGQCTPNEFVRWVKYEVALHENEWKRIGADETS